MRRAFDWLYEELDKGRSRHSILCRAARQKTLQSAIRGSFQKFDELVEFDLHRCSGRRTVIGIDEVGRGPLAGPLVAACVELPYPVPPLLPFLRDSKQLKKDERELLAECILRCAKKVSFGVVEATEFGAQKNLHQLTFLAMERALEQFQDSAQRFHLLVDGKFTIPTWRGAQSAIVGGDDQSLSVAAASVVAKVYRDNIMTELDRTYPQYGFSQHVGYGTAQHRQALLKHGPCPQHRTNFLTTILTGSGHS